MTPRLSPRAVWLTLHEPRAVTALYVAAYGVAVYGGLGVVTVEHGLLPVGVWSARMVAGWAWIVGGLIAAPMAWRGIWWAERIGIALLLLGFCARVLAVAGMGDAGDAGVTVNALTAWVMLGLVILARGVWVRVSPYRLGAGPLPPELDATLARARIERAERGRDA